LRDSRITLSRQQLTNPEDIALAPLFAAHHTWDDLSIVMLQAYIDDSRTAEEVLVLAGYLAHPARWKQFSTAWRRLLEEYPSWAEFKMNRACRYPERVERFRRIIEGHVAAYVACVLEIGALRKLCHELALPEFCANPYNFAIKAILGATYTELGRVGLRWPIEFIFDERGEKRHLESAWEFFLLGMPAQVHPIIYGKPRFENSAHFYPLQAAEIVAWEARKHWLKHRKFSDPSEQLWHQCSAIKGYLVHWNYEALRPNMESLRDLLLGWDYPLPPKPS
jgi:hypothetical protein